MPCFDIKAFRKEFFNIESLSSIFTMYYKEIKEEDLKLDKTLGYIYFLDKAHPLSHKATGRVYYHRHIASLKMGRWLKSDEHVHHINENKQDNSPENLVVLSNSEHVALHYNIERVELTCTSCLKFFTVSIKDSTKRKYCSAACSGKASQKWEVTKEYLELLIWNKPYVQISKIAGISDTAVKKKAVSLGCKMPPPYFFSKTEEYRANQRKLHGIPDMK